MSYLDITIKTVVEKIRSNEIYLPAIQRKFVWKYEQIEKLFDSIMLGYPIGTFLFWKVEKKLANDYTFYKFIQEYHERDNFLNELASKPEMKEFIIGVLDGQQRLSSLFLALQGSYAYKKPRARWDNDDAFPKRQMYLNLLQKNTPRETEDTTYIFKFLTLEEAAEKTNETFWFPVKEALVWDENDVNCCFDFARKNHLLDNELALKNLTLLWQRITKDKIINYFEIKNNELDEILDIFIRVNSGGTVLSKSDLLMSTIVAHWEKAREEIETLLTSINKKGEHFDFDSDFIMRTCLVLTDCPVLFSVKNFKRGNVERIRANWDLIKKAIITTVDLLVEFGFSQENLTSKNAIIPIAYYLFKGGLLDNNDKDNIRKYIIASMLKLVYGGKGDQVLATMRNALRKEENGEFVLKFEHFPLKTLIDTKLPSDKSLSFSDEDIESLFEYKKSPYTFMVLSLIYPHLKLSRIKFHQDHIHPASSFKRRNLQKEGIAQDKWDQWVHLMDTLPNLQLLEGSENEIKSKTPFEKWYGNFIPDNEKSNYLSTNYIPSTDFCLANFEAFYHMRKEKLFAKFRQIFD